MKSPKSMSFDELITLRDTVDNLIASMAASVKKELRNRLVQIESLVRKAPSARGRDHPLRGRKVSPKYRNPQNRSETWAGRGAMPRWLSAFIKQGRKLEEFSIQKSARGASKTKRKRRGT